MNYKKIYDSIIDRAKNREFCGYTEKHHIIPRCMGGGDEESNLVRLTPEEHYVCHQLLVKLYPGNVKLVYAIQAMSMSGPTKARSNKVYAWLKKRYIKSKLTGTYKKCKCCNAEFYARANRIDRPFCSRECFNNYGRSFLTCKNCHKQFTRPNSLSISKNAFCSVDCKFMFNSFTFNCKTCATVVRVPKCRLRQGIPTYCSRKCKGNCR